LEERAGIERKGDVHTVTFAVAKRAFADKTFLLLDGPAPVDYQVLDVRESVPVEELAATHPATLTYKVAFPVDLAPHARKMLLVVQGRPKATGRPAFNIQELKQDTEKDVEESAQESGPVVGKTVSSDRLSLEFHPQSGQVNTISYPRENIKLYSEIGVVHWNPGCYIPGVAWDHSFNWTTAPGYEEVTGPYLYVNSRRGPMQTIRDITLEMKYTMVKGAPYFLSETLMRVTKDMGVLAIRNDEMVLYGGLFDSLICKDRQGKVVTMPLKEESFFPDGFVHMAPDDVPWVGLLNTEKKYGFFSLRIDYLNCNLHGTGDWLNRAGTYFYAPSPGKYIYWVRPLVYSWSEMPTRNVLTHVREGSFFYEKNAYIALPLKEGFADELDRLLLKLKNPVKIY
jgi:hypothetical protein